MFEDNAVDFVKKWKTVFVIYCEQGVESTKSEFKQLKITFCQTRPASRRLENMLQEHYRHIHPKSKVFKFKNKSCRKRKITL